VDSDSTIKAFLCLTESEKIKQLPPGDDEYYGYYGPNCGEICCLIFVGLFLIGGIIGMFIVMPLFATILLGSLVLLSFGPNMVSAAKNSWNNYMIRRNFHKLLSTESLKPPETVKFSGGLFFQLQAAPQCKPPILEAGEAVSGVRATAPMQRVF